MEQVKSITPEQTGGLLILVLACKDPTYSDFDLACRDTWVKDARSKGVRIIFYYGGMEEKFINDDLYLKTNDSHAHLAQKFIKALQFILKSKLEFDCIYRTNHSSALDIDKLIATYHKIKNDNLYAGVIGESSLLNLDNLYILPRFPKLMTYLRSLLRNWSFSFASGSGFFISKKNVEQLLNSDYRIDMVDDVMTGYALHKAGIQILELSRVDFLGPDVVIKKSELTPKTKDIFHFRNKSPERDTDIKRMYRLHELKYDVKKLINES